MFESICATWEKRSLFSSDWPCNDRHAIPRDTLRDLTVKTDYKLLKPATLKRHCHNEFHSNQSISVSNIHICIWKGGGGLDRWPESSWLTGYRRRKCLLGMTEGRWRQSDRRRQKHGNLRNHLCQMIIPNGVRKCFKVAAYIKYLRNEIFIGVFIRLQNLEKARNPVYGYYIQLSLFF
jgi:hypothetical protein